MVVNLEARPQIVGYEDREMGTIKNVAGQDLGITRVISVPVYDKPISTQTPVEVKPIYDGAYLAANKGYLELFQQAKFHPPEVFYGAGKTIGCIEQGKGQKNYC